MTNVRLKQLKTFLNEDPNDPFTIYAIATEHMKNDLQEARHYFEILLRDHPDYVATYYHAAHLYWKLKLHEKAVETFENGIQQAQQHQDQLALRELRSAYELYRFEEEDD